MYVPTHFEESDPQVLATFMTEHPFAALITHGSHGLNANHLPFEILKRDTAGPLLQAHVARKNPVWKTVKDGDEVLVLFHADDAYISPNWYPSKQITPRHVPTWNYRAVHAHGRITIHDDEKYVRGLVARLTRTHERAQRRPWKMTDAPPDFIDAMLKAIVGIEIEVTRLTGKFKLSQNRDDADRIGAATALMQQGDTPLGQAMLNAGLQPEE